MVTEGRNIADDLLNSFGGDQGFEVGRMSGLSARLLAGRFLGWRRVGGSGGPRRRQLEELAQAGLERGDAFLQRGDPGIAFPTSGALWRFHPGRLAANKPLSCASFAL
jgi:hypothetical protein